MCYCVHCMVGGGEREVVTVNEARLILNMIPSSKFLSKHLRHRPERIGLTLEPGGRVCESFAQFIAHPCESLTIFALSGGLEA